MEDSVKNTSLRAPVMMRRMPRLQQSVPTVVFPVTVCTRSVTSQSRDKFVELVIDIGKSLVRCDQRLDR